MNREDLEMIAALVDGKLSPAQRRSAFERMESDPDLYETFLETLHLTEQVAEPDFSGFSWLPIGRTLSHRGAGVFVGLASILLLVVFWPRSEPVPDASVIVALLMQRDTGAIFADELWYERANGARLRSAKPSGGSNLSWSLGTARVDLEVAIRGGQTVSGRIIAQRLIEQLDAVGGMEDQERTLRSIATGAEGSTSGVVTMLRRLDKGFLGHPSVDPSVYRLAAWCEVGRFAAESQRVELLAGQDFGRVLEALISEKHLAGDAREELHMLAVILEHEPLDLNRIQTVLGRLGDRYFERQPAL